MKWKPLLVGAALGAIVGFAVGMGQGKGGANPLGVTGRPNQPYQFGIDPGKGVRGG